MNREWPDTGKNR